MFLLNIPGNSIQTTDGKLYIVTRTSSLTSRRGMIRRSDSDGRPVPRLRISKKTRLAYRAMMKGAEFHG